MSLAAADSLAVADVLRQAAAWVLRSGCEACVLAGLVLVAQRALRGRVSARWSYNLWLLVVARLFLPDVPGVGVSPFNLMPRVAALEPAVGARDSGPPAVAAASAAAVNSLEHRTSAPSRCKRRPSRPGASGKWLRVRKRATQSPIARRRSGRESSRSQRRSKLPLRWRPRRLRR